MDANFSSGAALPVLIGLITGVGFFVLIGYTMSTAHVMRYMPPVDLDEFDTPDRLSEVKFLSNKYQDELLKGFGRSDNKTIEFYYEVGKVVDTNNDGYQETLHRLELRLTYDESNGPIEDNNDPRLLKMQARCTEQSPTDRWTFVDIMAPAKDGQVLDFISNAKCIF